MPIIGLEGSSDRPAEASLSSGWVGAAVSVGASAIVAVSVGCYEDYIHRQWRDCELREP